ncbi:MAG: hypothetical protein V2A79_14650 [Planctomycetota bacterium]
MRGIAQRIRLFLQWLFSPEQLPEPPGEPPETTGQSARFWDWVCSGAELPQAYLPDGQPVAQARFLHWLVMPEVCPEDEMSVDRRRVGVLGSLFAGEICPEYPIAAAPYRVGCLHGLFSPEKCPEVEPPACQPRAGLLRWLLSHEKL